MFFVLIIHHQILISNLNHRYLSKIDNLRPVHMRSFLLVSGNLRKLRAFCLCLRRALSWFRQSLLTRVYKTYLTASLVSTFEKKIIWEFLLAYVLMWISIQFREKRSVFHRNQCRNKAVTRKNNFDEKSVRIDRVGVALSHQLPRPMFENYYLLQLPQYCTDFYETNGILLLSV